MRIIFALLAILYTVQPAFAADQRESYITIERDTLYAIADRADIYGDHAMWIAIWEANKDVLQSPHAVPAGVTLRIPRDLSMLEILNYRQRAENYKREDNDDNF